MPFGRTLVIYHFYEKDGAYIDNFSHFMEFGYRPDIEFLVVVSGDYSIELPQAKNIRYAFAENKNNDFGGYCSVLRRADWVYEHDHYLFVNSSVRGPFMAPPAGSSGWLERFLAPLSTDVGLVGSSINILSEQSVYSRLYRERFGGRPPLSHVQSTVYAMARQTLAHLVQAGFYDEGGLLSKDEVICRYELGLSQQVLQAGLDLKCQLPEYNRIDYRRPHSEINLTSVDGDPSHPGAYFGRTIHPYEGLFVKTNRDLFLSSYLDRLAASMRTFAAPEGQVLTSRPLSQYRERLASVSRSRDSVGFSQITLSPEQVIGLSGQLAQASPAFRAALAQVLRSA